MKKSSFDIEGCVEKSQQVTDGNFKHNLMIGVILNNHNKDINAAGRILLYCACCKRLNHYDCNRIDGVGVDCEEKHCPFHNFMSAKRYELKEVVVRPKSRKKQVIMS